MKWIKSSIILKTTFIFFTFIFFSLLHLVFFVFKIRANKIVVSNFYGKGYGDNPKYIVEELLKTEKNLDIVWLVKNKDDLSIPNIVRKVKIFSVQSVYELLTANVWIDNCRKYFFYNIFKKKETLYIQTWHGGVGLKKVEKAVQDNLSKSYVLSAKHDSSMVDYFLSGSRWMTENIKKNFWFNGEILQYGSPRNDMFFENLNFKEKIYKNYRIPTTDKILLFAPTFRKNNICSKFMDFNALIVALNERFGGNWIILLRLHPNIRDIKLNLPKNIINASFYEDSQELLCAADALITDYSSIMFDMMLLEKPVFIYATDIEDYAKDRNFEFDFSELPFLYAQNDSSLIQNIINFNEKSYKDDLKKFTKSIGLSEAGKASINVSKIILEHLKYGLR